MSIPSNSDVDTICIYYRCYWQLMVLPLVKSGQLYYRLKLMLTFFTVWSMEEVTLDLVENDSTAVVNDVGITDGREYIPDSQE